MNKLKEQIEKEINATYIPLEATEKIVKLFNQHAKDKAMELFKEILDKYRYQNKDKVQTKEYIIISQDDLIKLQEEGK